MTTVDGFQPDSSRIPAGFRAEGVPDSALRTEQNRTEQGKTTSSGLMHKRAGARITDAEAVAEIRSVPQAHALARLILDLRPDWNPALVWRWALTDDRAWAVVIRAGIDGASDPGIKHPNGLATVGPSGKATPRALTIAEAAALAPCPNGAFHTPHPCALCRAGITTTIEETTP